jgi:LysR family glycine cleavage system transcriptional activator
MMLDARQGIIAQLTLKLFVESQGHMIYLPPLKAVLAFEVVARHASFGKAAEELNLTTSAVSHQITTLEEYVGCQLFLRTSRGVTLTVAGERYLQSLSGALAIIADATHSARLETGDEILRVHSSPSFASLWLMPRLAKFRAAYPEIKIRVFASPGGSDFSKGEIDLDIRYGIACWAKLRVENIFTEEIMPMMSPSLKSRLKIESPEDLLVQDLIFCERDLVQWPQWFAANSTGICPSEYALHVDRAQLAMDAAVQGFGIALQSNKLADGLLKNGHLVPVFPGRKGIRVHQHHLVFPAQHANQKRVAKFVSWIRTEAKK